MTKPESHSIKHKSNQPHSVTCRSWLSRQWSAVQ